jgi:hypothetical protein
VDHDNDHRVVEKRERTILSVKCGIKFLHKGGTKEKEERKLCLANAYVTAFLLSSPNN